MKSGKFKVTGKMQGIPFETWFHTEVSANSYFETLTLLPRVYTNLLLQFIPNSQVPPDVACIDLPEPHSQFDDMPKAECGIKEWSAEFEEMFRKYERDFINSLHKDPRSEFIDDSEAEVAPITDTNETKITIVPIPPMRVICLCCGREPASLITARDLTEERVMVRSECCNQVELKHFTDDQMKAIEKDGGWTAFLSK